MEKVVTPDKTQEQEKISPSMPIDEAQQRFVFSAKKIIPGFVIDSDNEEVIEGLIKYFNGQKSVINGKELDLKKAICLSGNVGSGKTQIMEILKMCKFSNRLFGIKECRDMSELFLNDHYKGIRIFGKGAVSVDKKRHMMFDDLGAENNINYYGNKVNVMADIITDRYKHFVNSDLKTHLTTNLTTQEIEDNYGVRLLSRMNEMMNFVVLGGSSSSKDRRN